MSDVFIWSFVRVLCTFAKIPLFLFCVMFVKPIQTGENQFILSS